MSDIGRLREALQGDLPELSYWAKRDLEILRSELARLEEENTRLRLTEGRLRELLEEGLDRMEKINADEAHCVYGTSEDAKRICLNHKWIRETKQALSKGEAVRPRCPGCGRTIFVELNTEWSHVNCKPKKGEGE